MLSKIIQEIARAHKIDERIVREICNSPFKFTADRMRNADTKPIKFNYLFKVLPKAICMGRLKELQQNDIKSKETEREGCIAN